MPNQQLTKLQAKWYAKLAKEGFKDIEQSEDKLARWDSFYFSTHYNPGVFASKEEYYRLAGLFLHEYEFSSDKERLIWDLHSQGLYDTEIYKELRRRRKRMFIQGIKDTIKRLSKKMVKTCL